MTTGNRSHEILVCFYLVILLSGIYPKEIIRQSPNLALQRTYMLWTQPKNLMIQEWFNQ